MSDTNALESMSNEELLNELESTIDSWRRYWGEEADEINNQIVEIRKEILRRMK